MLDARRLGEQIVVPKAKKFVAKAAAATLQVFEQIVHVDTSVAGFTLTMPNVSEAAGYEYDIHLVAGATNACTVTALQSRDWPGDFTLDATNDRIVLRSDGERWSTVFSGIT